MKVRMNEILESQHQPTNIRLLLCLFSTAAISLNFLFHKNHLSCTIKAIIMTMPTYNYYLLQLRSVLFNAISILILGPTVIILELNEKTITWGLF